jgi:hypothetical protein
VALGCTWRTRLRKDHGNFFLDGRKAVSYVRLFFQNLCFFASLGLLLRECRSPLAQRQPERE